MNPQQDVEKTYSTFLPTFYIVIRDLQREHVGRLKKNKMAILAVIFIPFLPPPPPPPETVRGSHRRPIDRGAMPGVVTSPLPRFTTVMSIRHARCGRAPSTPRRRDTSSVRQQSWNDRSSVPEIIYRAHPVDAVIVLCPFVIFPKVSDHIIVSCYFLLSRLLFFATSQRSDVDCTVYVGPSVEFGF